MFRIRLLSVSILFSLSCIVVAVEGVNSGSDTQNTAKNEVLSDPTRPLHYAVKQKKTISLNLQAVIKKGGVKQAIVNGVVLREGDIYKSHQIKRINEKSVLYEINGVTKTLRLRPSVI